MHGDRSEIDELKRLIDECSRAVVFTGAGISKAFEDDSKQLDGAGYYE